jgi:hypothetical protein
MFSVSYFYCLAPNIRYHTLLPRANDVPISQSLFRAQKRGHSCGPCFLIATRVDFLQPVPAKLAVFINPCADGVYGERPPFWQGGPPFWQGELATRRYNRHCRYNPPWRNVARKCRRANDLQQFFNNFSIFWQDGTPFAPVKSCVSSN